MNSSVDRQSLHQVIATPLTTAARGIKPAINESWEGGATSYPNYNSWSSKMLVSLNYTELSKMEMHDPKVYFSWVSSVPFLSPSLFAS